MPHVLNLGPNIRLGIKHVLKKHFHNSWKRPSTTFSYVLSFPYSFANLGGRFPSLPYSLTSNEDLSTSTPFRQLQDPVRMRAVGGNERDEYPFRGGGPVVLVQGRIRNINPSLESPKL